MRYTLVSPPCVSLAVIAIAVKALFLPLRLGRQHSSRSHRVLGRTMSSRRSPPRGNSGGFAFEVVANPAAVLPAVLDEDLVGVEPGREHAGDVHARYVGLHGGGVVPWYTRGLVHRHAERAEQAQVCTVACKGHHEVRRDRLAFAVRLAAHHRVSAPDLDHAAAPADGHPALLERFVMSGRTHGFTPRSKSPRKCTIVPRAFTRVSSSAASTALFPPPTTTTRCCQ